MSKLGKLSDLVRRSGAVEASTVVALKLADRLVGFKVLQIFAITRTEVDPRYLELDDRYDAGFLEAGPLACYVAAHPELPLSVRFVRESYARGDRCYAVSDRGAIVSYGWYTNHPAAMFDGLTFHFDSAYTYMHFCFTRPEYRGRRLHAVATSRALDAVTQRGSAGLVAFVDRANFASLRSMHRIGFRRVAKFVVMPAHGAHRVVRLGGRPRPEVSVQSTALAV